MVHLINLGGFFTPTYLTNALSGIFQPHVRKKSRCTSRNTPFVNTALPTVGRPHEALGALHRPRWCYACMKAHTMPPWTRSLAKKYKSTGNTITHLLDDKYSAINQAVVFTSCRLSADCRSHLFHCYTNNADSRFRAAQPEKVVALYTLHV